MKLKTCLLGQSLICLGMIASHTEVAQADVGESLTKAILIQELENSDTSQSSFLTIQLPANSSSLINTPIAPPERIQAIAHNNLELSNPQFQNSCFSSNTSDDAAQHKAAAIASAPAAIYQPHCNSVQPDRFGMASPELVVERSEPSARQRRPSEIATTARQRRPSEIATTHKSFLPLIEQAIAENFPPELLESPPLEAAPTADVELGQLRLWETSSEDPELGRLRLWEEPSGDPELGRLRLQEQPLLEESIEETDEDVVFLLGRLSFFSSDNILLDAFDPVDDQVFEAGVGLFASPSLGPNTYLFGGIGRSLSVYNHLSGLNYSDLEINAGIRQVIFDNTYVDASWSNQQFFGLDSSGRFFTDNSLRLALSHREQLTQQLFLDGYYQLRFSFTDPSDRSRIFNNFGISLGYDLEPGLEAGLGYQLILSDFTQEERHDSYHEITAQLSYDVSDNARVTVFGGFSFGDSTEQSLNFNSSLFGLIFSTNFSLF